MQFIPFAFFNFQPSQMIISIWGHYTQHNDIHHNDIMCNYIQYNHIQYNAIQYNENQYNNIK